VTVHRFDDIPCQKLVCCQKRPLEMYYFIDPLHPVCLDQDPIIKKLLLEYGHYIRLTYVLFGKFTPVPTIPAQPNAKNNPVTIGKPPRNIMNQATAPVMECLPDIPFLAIKAAELQGRKAGIRYLKKIQEHYFYKNEDVTKLDTLLACAHEAELDVSLFEQDLDSKTPLKALVGDLQIMREMDIEEIPAVVIFNTYNDEEGLKLVGVNPYEVYVDILTEMLKKVPVRRELPSLLSYIQYKQFVTTKEITIIYNWHWVKAELELKKLLLRREIQKIQTKYGTAWRYAGDPYS